MLIIGYLGHSAFTMYLIPFMNKTIYIPLLILFLTSCNNNTIEEKPTQETSEALEDKSYSYETVLKREHGDLVENFYAELLTKDIKLKRLENQINQLRNSKGDTTESFDNFNEKNQSYFNSADSHIAAIKDSLLRIKLKFLVDSSLTKYNSRIASHKELVKHIESNQMTISDLHNVLKIIRTLPLIDKYQKDNLPNTKSLEGYINKQEEVIKYADTLKNM